MLLASSASTWAGAAIATTLFADVGVMGTLTLRLTVSAVILLALCRPSLRQSRSAWATITAFGLALACMNSCIYLALGRIDMGVAVSLETLGPLALFVVASRSVTGVAAAAVAAVGVALLCVLGTDVDHPSGLGIALALASGCCWAGYILLSAQAGRRLKRLDGLALAMTVAALLQLPFGASIAGSRVFAPRALTVGALIAVLATVIPYALELLALRRLKVGAAAFLLSCSPAVAALAGWVILGQTLAWTQLLGLVLVVLATTWVATSTTLLRGPS